MPLIDMPLEQLKKYNGTNPKPKDFDKYWAESISEMQAIDPQVEITYAEFQSPIADCYDLYFTGVHGARVYAKLLKPKNINSKSPAVLNFHGYSAKSSGWGEYLAYAASGFIVAALDCRGQAGKSQDAGGHIGNTLHGHIIRGLENDDPKMLLFRDIFLDTAELANIIINMEDVDEDKVFAYGGSQGGALTIACASLEPRIKFAACMYPFLSDYKRVWEMDMTERAYAELKEYFRNFDPRHERENEIFTKLGYIDIQNLAPRINATIKMITGLMDNVCPPSTQFAAFNKMKCPKEVIIYPDYGHEAIPEAWELVYSWFLNEIQNDTRV